MTRLTLKVTALANMLISMTERCAKYVSSRTIEDKMEITGKTVRAWAERFKWRMERINARVIRYCAEDVEKSLNVDLSR